MTFEQWWDYNYSTAFDNPELEVMGRAIKEVAERAWNEKPGFNGPAKFTEEEIADNNRAIRWITADGVHGRPSDHDVREYLERTPQLTGCTCEKCKVFYGGTDDEICRAFNEGFAAGETAGMRKAASALGDQVVSLHVGGNHFVFGSPEATEIVQAALYQRDAAMSREQSNI